jgi:hypothetical protein
MEFVKNQQLMDFGVTAIMDTVVKIALRERTVNIYRIHNIMTLQSGLMCKLFSEEFQSLIKD